jgi:RNA polymerase sigma factor (sigma-70 family)
VTVDVEVWVSGEVGEPCSRPEEDPAAFYRAHAPEFMRFATTLVGADDAADVVASAVAKTLAAREWSSLDNPRAYVFRAVFREAMSWRRLAARRALRHTADAGHLGAVERAIGPDMTESRSRVVQAVAGLSGRQRAVVFLAYWDDKRIDDIAEILGLSTGAVKKHLARARQTLRTVLGDEEEDA